LMFLMSDYYEEPLSFKEITKRLNKTPYRIPGHKMCYPVEAFGERLNIVRARVAYSADIGQSFRFILDA